MTELYKPSAGEHPITPPPEMTKPLPAAVAVLDACNDVVERLLLSSTPEQFSTPLIAAALEAVADQVVPLETAPEMMRGHELERLAQRQHTRSQLLAIAAELRVCG